MVLSHEAFDKAKGFINAHARPLEQALFVFYLNDGPQEAVLDALAGFQNEDGGFGHALEPDIRLPNSSPMVTTIAFQVMRDVGVSADHEMVKKGIQFLLDTYDADLGRWNQVPPAVNDHHRAPWWTYDANNAQEKGFRANASAEIVGHLSHYRVHVPDEFLEEMIQKALEHLDGLPDAMEMHDVLCYLSLLEANGLSDAERVQIGYRMLQAGSEIVTRDPEKWSGYSNRPLWLAPLSTSPLAEVLKPEVELNLDYEIEHQGEDGAWHPFWSWGSEGWKVAEQDWKGVLTVKTLRSLKAFERI